MTTPAPSYPTKTKPWALGLIVALIVGVLGFIAFGLIKSYKTPKTISLQGVVHTETVNVASKLPSRVGELFAKEGDKVHEGDLLVSLISPEIEAKKQQAAAALQSAQARQSAVNRGTRSENVASLYANWQAAQAQAKLAEDTAKRSDYLYQEGVISRLRRDEMQTASVSANALAESARQQYLKADSGRSDEAKDSVDAQVAIAKAAVAEADALDGETRLHAPIAGTVSKIYAKPSELVVPSAPIITLIDEHPHVLLTVPENHYAHIYKQQTLTGYIPALAQSAQFAITHIDAEGEFATIKSTKPSDGYDIRSFSITLTAQSALPELKSGMSVLFDIAVTP